MTIHAIQGMLQPVEVDLALMLLLLLAGAMLFRFARAKPRVTGAEIQPEIVDALTLYLGGNRDSGRLRALASKHSDEVRETILRYQTIVAGRREELCELTIALGYVERWCQGAHSTKITERRKAFSGISAVAHYEPVRRLVGDIPANALRDPDEQIRLEAARILLATGEPAAIDRVFEAVLSDTVDVRLTIARELRRHATQLCRAVVPQALRSPNPREVLRLLVSWECGLPLADVRPHAEHPDPAVRVEVMRLLTYLPATRENRDALLSGLADEDHYVRTAAEAAADRLRPAGPAPGENIVESYHPIAAGDGSIELPDLDSVAPHTSEGWLELVRAEGGSGC